MCRIPSRDSDHTWLLPLLLPLQDKADIIHKYNTEEAMKLKQFGELPENAITETGADIGDGAVGEDDDGDFEFDVDDI